MTRTLRKVYIIKTKLEKVFIIKKKVDLVTNCSVYNDDDITILFRNLEAQEINLTKIFKTKRSQEKSISELYIFL